MVVLLFGCVIMNPFYEILNMLFAIRPVFSFVSLMLAAENTSLRCTDSFSVSTLPDRLLSLLQRSWFLSPSNLNRVIGHIFFSPSSSTVVGLSTCSYAIVTVIFQRLIESSSIVSQGFDLIIRFYGSAILSCHLACKSGSPGVPPCVTFIVQP